MSFAQTVVLGAIAGFTIFIGLPFGRLQRGGRGLRIFLGGLSGGILVFLLFDILSHATEPLEAALTDRNPGQLGALGVAYVVGFGVGLLSLFYAPRWRRRAAGIGPGAMAVAEADPALLRSDTLALGMTIAAGIGLHNFSEGLAIGQSAASGAISLALLLIIGFGLHNATEGFGIVGPLVARDVRPSWSWLVVAGLVGGGPTFLGTIVGTAVNSPIIFVAFLALAAGAILNVVGELIVAGRRASWELTLWGLKAARIDHVDWRSGRRFEAVDRCAPHPRAGTGSA
ncbi:MAG: ZIP family metal transporter [Chloroflexi bacterium]|nr:ZIP family metal transporter [Chloroflexota bacterium]